jgi:hypothetical protein
LIIRTNPGGVFDLEVRARQPMVYLDNWALSRALAVDETRRERFLETFKTKGTLLFSWVNVMELGNSIFNRSAPIRLLLDGIGEQWFPIESNPFASIKKENSQQGAANSPAFSETLLRAYYPHVHGGVLTLSSVFDLLRHDNGAKARGAQQQLKATVQQFIDEIKQGHRLDPTWLDKRYPTLAFDPQRPTLFVFTELLRGLASERGFTFTPNDGIDLFHATVPVAYSDFVLLDRSWTRRVRALSMPGRALYAFAEPELDGFLDAFERCEIVSGI